MNLKTYFSKISSQKSLNSYGKGRSAVSSLQKVI